MSSSDHLYRFVFEDAGVRGELVHLDAAWRAVLAIHPYPAAVSRQLGEALAAVQLLAGTFKLAGSLILQVQGDGPVRTLVAQATHNRTLRGLARWQGAVPERPLAAVFGEGRLVLTIEPIRGERYQGIVPLAGADLAGALETYFGASEQLPTRLWLMADEDRAAGLMLQRLPAAHGSREDWERIGLLAHTLTSRELGTLAAEDLLYRLFHEERVRIFEPDPIAFRCTCSRERVEGVLRALGRTEVEDILAEQGAIEVDCEFCNRHYRLDSVDALKLFTDTPAHQAPLSRH
jgi:molecular chaperone Hsp33